jgi:hypothetical protein
MEQAKCPCCGYRNAEHLLDGKVVIVDNVDFLVTIIKCSACGAVLGIFPKPPLQTEKG